MRHFLKFLTPERRAEALRQERGTKARTESNETPRAGGHGQCAPRPKAESAPAKPAATASKPTPDAPKRTQPGPRVAPKPSKPSMASGPEFGGLIERRKSSRESMPAAASPADKSRPVANRTPVTEKSWDTRFDIDANDIRHKLEKAVTESTGVFLASLDNSSITLADSGLFKLEESDEEKSESKKKKPESFNPYDHN